MIRRPERYKSSLPPLFIAAVLAGIATPAAAAGFTDFFGNILNEFNSVRRPLALIAIIMVGFAWLFNFFDLSRAGKVVAGIIVIFAATEILDMIIG